MQMRVEIEDFEEAEKEYFKINPNKYQSKIWKILNVRNEIVENQALADIVEDIRKRHGIGCDCGFCECLHNEKLKNEEKHAHWVLHTGNEYTEGSMINTYATEADAVKALENLRFKYNISKLPGKWME